MPHSDAGPRFGNAQIFCNRIVERECVLLDQHHHRDGGELFGHRSGLKHGVWRHAHAVFQIRHTVTLAKHDLAVGSDHERASRDLFSSEIIVDETIDAVGCPSGWRYCEQWPKEDRHCKRLRS